MSVLRGVHHVKLPVTDLGRSRAWYERVLGLEVDIEFVEDDTLMGVAMNDPGRSVCVALRLDPDLARAIKGFDPVAFAVATHADLLEWRARLDALDEPHGGVVTGHQGWALTGLHDPDGLELRLYTVERHDGQGAS